MHILILGNGVAGITAARTIRKLSNYRITVVSGESDHFFSRTALMYVFMGHLRLEDIKPYEDWFWTKNGIELRRGYVEKMDVTARKLIFDDGTSLGYDRLLLATGSQPNKFGWPGQDLDGVQGLYSLQDLEGMEFYSRGLQRAVLVGGGLIGVEMAEMLHSRQVPVTFLVREKHFWDLVLPLEEAQMVTRHIREHGIDLRLETELKEIWGDRQSNRAKAVVTNRGEKITCGFVGLTAGVRPNVDFLHFSGIELGKGVVVNEFLQTNLPDIFAAGDCAELRQVAPGRRSIEAVWYVARKMGEVAGQNLVASLAEQMTARSSPLVIYDPGIWFNSAKFFDIEYQTYGNILPQLPEHQSTLYWEHPEGKKSIRINWDKHTGSVVGFNLMGIRYRQEVCERWIRSGAHVEEVLQNLGLANFDPEFFEEYEAAVVGKYNLQEGRDLALRQRRGLAGVLKFFKV